MNNENEVALNINSAHAKNKEDSLWGKLIPELMSVAMILGVLFVPRVQAWINIEIIFLILIIEGGMLMANATLIDLASRLKKPPPWWLAIIILAGVIFMSPGGMTTLQMAWLGGAWFFLPTLWSMFERIREMWTLPKASTLEKIRRRTLTFDRLYTGLLLAGCCVVVGIYLAIKNEGSMPIDIQSSMAPWFLLGMYGISSFNVWRVYQNNFAKSKSSLFPFIDQEQNTYLGDL